jgi:hypothetical protein
MYPSMNRIQTAAVSALLAMLLLYPVAAAAQAPAPLAGTVTSLVPVGTVERMGKPIELTKGMEIFWGDVVKTARGARARIRLSDGSILNVGSDSSLKVVKHDARAQNTDLELLYGKVRANATRITTPGGDFKVRTRAAVAGVVGTEKYLAADDLRTLVLALGGGRVRVASTDPRFTDAVELEPGEAVSVSTGRPPGAKRPASPQELQQAVEETEADPVLNLARNIVSPGGALSTEVTGARLNTATAYSASHPGIRVSPAGQATATRVTLNIAVGADVPPGTYTITVERPEGPARGAIVVMGEAAEAGAAAAAPASSITPPPARSLSGIRGAKFTLDASAAQSSGGSRIVSFQWRISNTQITGSGETFEVNTSLINPGSYNVELVVTNDRGQSATQRYPLEVQRGDSPEEILKALANAYESLQPSQFLRYFDEVRFRNYAGFAAAIEDSFRNRLESMRVFPRAVNCSVVEAQDQAVCQSDFEINYTEKNQPLELLDPQGNPVPAGVAPPPGSALGKAVRRGVERVTVRYERADAGWKIVDYASSVTTTGVGTGSTVIGTGSAATPTFTLANASVLTPDISLGGTVSGSVDVLPVAGFNGAVTLSGSAQVGNQPISVQFNPNPATPGTTVSFTVVAPTTVPAGFTGATPFTLVITGRDGSGSLNSTANVNMTLQPDYTLSVSPPTTATGPVAGTHNASIPLTVTIGAGAGFAGSVFVDFPNLPPGFVASAGNVSGGASVPFPLQVTSAAAPGPAQITVRATSATSLVKTSTVFINVTSDFTVTANSATGFVGGPGGTIPVTVTVVPISGFAGSVVVDFLSLPAGFTPTPPSATVAAGASSPFNLGLATNVPLGGATITVRGTFGATVRTLSVNVNVQAAPPASGSGALAPVQQPGSGPSAPVSAPGGPPRGGTRPGIPPPANAPTEAENPLAPRATGGVGKEAPGKEGTRGPGGRGDARGRPTARAERATLQMDVGSCVALQFSSGRQDSCGGASDVEFHALSASEVRISGEGVRNLGAAPLDQAPPPGGASSPTATAQQGMTYHVQLRRGNALVRITQVRADTGRRTPLSRDRAAGGAAQPAPAGAATGVMVTVEWRVIQE